MQTAIPFFALTTYGLEVVSAREVITLPDVTIMQIAYRRVVGLCRGPLAGLLGLHTVDDVFVEVARWSEIGRHRAALQRLRGLSATLDMGGALAACAGLRPLNAPPSFSVTVSFVGRRNYTTAEIKAVLAAGIARSQGWAYRADDLLADLNVRVFIEHDLALVGVRLAARPLHERPYRRVERVGALRPPVAAALLMLAGGGPGVSVLDPCCGSGTILIEAALVGAHAIGGDSDPTAITAARANAVAAGVAPRLSVWDSRRLSLAGASVDRAVSNLPWGRQVTIDDGLALFYRATLGELRRVIAPGGHVVLLSGVPHLADVPGLRCLDRAEISLFGQRPTVLVLRVE